MVMINIIKMVVKMMIRETIKVMMMMMNIPVVISMKTKTEEELYKCQPLLSFDNSYL